MTALIGRPRLTLDIGYLFTGDWTGIPVFTRRLAQALLSNGELDIEFANDLVRVPADLARQALHAGTGRYLVDEMSAEDGPELVAVDPDVPVFYPGNKGRYSGMLAREASTVHDLTTLFMPETHDETNVAFHLDHLAAELRTDEAVFCISEATRATLIEAAPSVASRTRLILQYVDWPDSFARIERNLSTPPMRPYALVIGTIEPRKNLQLLFDALDHPLVAKTGLLFIVLGKEGFLVEGFLSKLAPAQRERVVFSGFVSEFIKYRLIRNAQFLIFPSLCEGFGIPALEAMSLGKPVLAARSSSLPEVIADAGVYFDPLSVDEFAYALTEIFHPRKLAELAPRAIKRNAEFTPERMAAPVVEWAKGGG
jgi:glycosyltransferase involved in cell wall biosynthesis